MYKNLVDLSTEFFSPTPRNVIAKEFSHDSEKLRLKQSPAYEVYP
jgi:hypothetical protein